MIQVGKAFDERRALANPGDQKQTEQFCIDHFFSVAKEALQARKKFTVSLSGGSTPKPIYEGIAERGNEIDWHLVHLYWTDERCVPPNHKDSNYKMAMEAGFAKLPIPAANIHRMKGELDPEKGALEYEHLLKKTLPDGVLDLCILGMGDDGHTASLFPQTHALHVENRLAVANYIPQKESWRLTLTYPCINHARNPVFYVLGKSKAPMLHQILNGEYEPNLYPSQKVGIASHPVLWIADNGALDYTTPRPISH